MQRMKTVIFRQYMFCTYTPAFLEDLPVRPQRKNTRRRTAFKAGSKNETASGGMCFPASPISALFMVLMPVGKNPGPRPKGQHYRAWISLYGGARNEEQSTNIWPAMTGHPLRHRHLQDIVIIKNHSAAKNLSRCFKSEPELGRPTRAVDLPQDFGPVRNDAYVFQAPALSPCRISANLQRHGYLSSFDDDIRRT